MADVLSRMKEQIVLCEKEYEAKKDDPFDSFILHSKLEMLQNRLNRLTNGESPEALLAELKKILPELEKAKEQEEDHPTFDWYDDHYHYKVLYGQCMACKEMIRLLESS